MSESHAEALRWGPTQRWHALPSIYIHLPLSRVWTPSRFLGIGVGVVGLILSFIWHSLPWSFELAWQRASSSSWATCLSIPYPKPSAFNP